MREKINKLFGFSMILFILPLLAFAQSGKDLETITESNKVALVIGNSKYQNGFSKLNSPKNDAVKIGDALKRLGFRLVGGKVHLDKTFRQMDSLVDLFTTEIKNGGVGFFYFSGHGSQDNNKDNFLIPVDTSIKYQNDLKHLALKVEFVTSRMEDAGNRLNILVLDACRNNPLPSGYKSGKSGLNTYGKIPSGVYIAYAARDGQVALDGSKSGLSLYTDELLKNIETPNQRLVDVFTKTRVAVKSQTKNKQYPMDYGSIDGRFYFKIDKSQNSSFNTNTSPRINPNRLIEAKRYFDLGLKCNSKDYDCKISNYSKAINLNPNYADAYNNRGNAYDNKKEYDRAIRDYNKAIEINPNDAIAYNNRGLAYDNKKEYDRAIRDYNKAIELNPNYANAYINRGIAYKNKKEYDWAIRDYTKAIELNPNYAIAYNNRGNAYYNKKEYDRAIRDYTKAIELNPNDAFAYYNRGIAYTNKKEYDRAIRDYNKAIELNPNYANAYYNRAISYDKIGETAKAEADRKKYNQLHTH